jgi:hypothetical protein
VEQLVAEKETASSPEGSPYRRRRLRVAPLLLALAFVFAIGVVAALWPFRQEKIAKSLEEKFNGKVTIGRYRHTAFPHPGVIAEDVVLRWETGSKRESSVVTVKRLIIRANYPDLLFRPGYISGVVLEGLRVHVPAGGGISTSSTNNDDGGSPARVGEVLANDAVLEILRREGEPLLFEIHTLKLTSVREGQPFEYRVAMHIPLPPGEVHSTGKFGPWNSQGISQTAASGKYWYENADLGVFGGIAGTLSSEGEFAGNLGQLQAKGQVDIPNFEVKRSKHAVPVKSQYQAVVNATNGNVQLQNVDSTVVATRVIAEGSVAKKEGGHGKTASLDLTVRQGRIEDVLRVFVKARRPPLNGVTAFRAHVVIPPGDVPFLKKVQLNGDFGIDQGAFTKQDTQEDVVKLSETGAGKKPKDGEETDPDNVVSAIAGHVELRGGIASFTDFSFSVPDAKATMHGTYNLVNEKIDLHGTLRTTAKFSETTSGVKSVLLKPFDAIFKRKHHDGAKVPVQLTGTYDDPHAGLEIIK